ncbi:MAG: hypothetical protein PVG19_08055, partial [Desulfobacterales bacterium]
GACSLGPIRVAASDFRQNPDTPYSQMVKNANEGGLGDSLNTLEGGFQFPGRRIPAIAVIVSNGCFRPIFLPKLWTLYY